MEEKQRIWNVNVLSIPLEEIIENIEGAVKLKRKSQVLVCVNPHSLVVANKDPIFLEAIWNSEFVIPDGFGIVLASKLLRGRIRKQITGPDVFMALSQRWNRENGKSFFFLGSSEEILKKIRIKMAAMFPNITVKGTFSPPFRDLTDEDNEKMVEMINNSGATALWVGMTAPKQEKWIHQHRERLEVPFIGAVGALFDFFAGTKKLPPLWTQRMGFTWLYRLAQEPKRLWRRTFISAPVFLFNVFLQKMGETPFRRKRKNISTS